MKQISPNVYVEISKYEYGCNSAIVVTSEGILAHDSQIMKKNTALESGKEVATYGQVRYVISGEPYIDHVGGFCYLGGVLIAHESTHEKVSNIQQQYETGALKFKLAPELNFYYRTPDIEIKDDITIYLGNHTFKIFVMPGHTPWNICTYVPEEKVIFTSDNLTKNLQVIYDSMPYEWIKNLEFMKTLDIDFIVGGHGEVMEKSAIDEFIKEIHMWLDPVEDAVKKGMSLEWVEKNITMEKEFSDRPEGLPKPEIVSKNVARVYNYLKNRDK